MILYDNKQNKTTIWIFDDMEYDEKHDNIDKINVWWGRYLIVWTWFGWHEMSWKWCKHDTWCESTNVCITR